MSLLIYTNKYASTYLFSYVGTALIFLTLFPVPLKKVGNLLKFLFTMLSNQFHLFVFVFVGF